MDNPMSMQGQAVPSSYGLDPAATRTTLADRVTSAEMNVAGHEKTLGAIMERLDAIEASLNRIGHEIGHH